MQEIKSLFTEWNEKHFGNKLADFRLEFYRRNGRICGKQRGRTILINTHYPMDSMKTTLLHEMVHAFLYATGRPHGHTPVFKAMLRNLYLNVFGVRATGNVRFHFDLPAATLTRPVTPVTPVTPTYVPPVVVPTLPYSAPTRYKVNATGEIGTLVRITRIYGKEQVTLTLASKMFPFMLPLENVTAL